MSTKTKVNIDGLNATSVKEMEEKIKRDKKRLSGLNEHNQGELQASIDEAQERVDAWKAAQKG